MAELTIERRQEITTHLAYILLGLRSFTVEELKQVIDSARQEEAIGPLLDPTKWINEDLFTGVRKTIEVLELLIKLKEALE